MRPGRPKAFAWSSRTIRWRGGSANVYRRRGQGERWIEVATTRYVWDRHRLVHEVTRAGDAERARTYVYEDDEFVPMAHYQAAMAMAGGAAKPVTDPAGAPDALVNLDGTIAGSIERRVWGRVRPRGSVKRRPDPFSGAVRRSGDGALLQPVPVLRSGHGALHQPRPDGAPRRAERVSVCAQPLPMGGPVRAGHHLCWRAN